MELNPFGVNKRDLVVVPYILWMSYSLFFIIIKNDTSLH